MAKTVAVIVLMVAAGCVALGNYWYTFGLWPRSWVAFFGFLVLQIIVRETFDAIRKDDLE
jgi:hypothetical protein